jgi:hypothetical protein
MQGQIFATFLCFIGLHRVAMLRVFYLPKSGADNMYGRLSLEKRGRMVSILILVARSLTG